MLLMRLEDLKPLLEQRTDFFVVDVRDHRIFNLSDVSTFGTDLRFS
jgi:hypothetical protein